MTTHPATSCEEFYFKRIALVEASAQDYREFFELLWRAHGEVLYKHAYSRLRNFEDARDVCQDAFVKAMQFIQDNPGRIPLKVNFGGWLRVIVRNLINDRFRKELIRPARMSAETAASRPVEQPPESRLVTSEDLAILHKCLDSLTEQARTIVLLRDKDGMSQKEIAAKLGSNPNAVCVALHRARKSLRECVSIGHVD